MECRDAQFYLRLRRHAADELGADVSAALEGHCAGCPTCGPAGRGAATFDRAVAAAMRAVPVPSGLRERLITQAARARGTALRRSAFRVGGLAAAALLLVAIGFSAYSKARPVVNSESLVESAEEQYKNPAAYARKWLADEKLPEQLPWDFDYDLLVTCGHERIGTSDRFAPVMTFRSREGSGFAKVYMFLEGGQFNTQEIRDVQGSHFRALSVIGKQQWRNVHYVVVHSGPPNQDLNHFRRIPGPIV